MTQGVHMPPTSKYYLRDKNGEPLMGFSDIYEGRAILNRSEPGTELVRAEDGVVVSVMWKHSHVPTLRFNLKRMGKRR